jgi:hypothetical protein
MADMNDQFSWISPLYIAYSSDTLNIKKLCNETKFELYIPILFQRSAKKDLFGKPQKVKSQDYWEQIVALSKKKKLLLLRH